MTNEIVKKEEETKPDLVKMELDEIRKDYSNPSAYDNEENLLNELNNLRKEKTPTNDQKKRKSEVKNEIGRLYGLENGVWIANIGHKKDYSTLARMRQKVIREYNCKTAIELMLADSISLLLENDTKRNEN